MEIINLSDRQGSRITISIPSYVDAGKDAENQFFESEAPSFSADWKEKLEVLRALKFYQTSQIRNAIRLLGEIDNESIQLWIEKLEVAVHEGDEVAYKRIMEMLTR